MLAWLRSRGPPHRKASKSCLSWAFTSWVMLKIAWDFMWDSYVAEPSCGRAMNCNSTFEGDTDDGFASARENSCGSRRGRGDRGQSAGCGLRHRHPRERRPHASHGRSAGLLPGDRRAESLYISPCRSEDG